MQKSTVASFSWDLSCGFDNLGQVPGVAHENCERIDLRAADVERAQYTIHFSITSHPTGLLLMNRNGLFRRQLEKSVMEREACSLIQVWLQPALLNRWSIVVELKENDKGVDWYLGLWGRVALHRTIHHLNWESTRKKFSKRFLTNDNDWSMDLKCQKGLHYLWELGSRRLTIGLFCRHVVGKDLDVPCTIKLSKWCAWAHPGVSSIRQQQHKIR